VVRGLQRDVVYLCRPIALRIRFPMRGMGGGGGGCGAPVNEYSCVYHVTWSPNKLRRSSSMDVVLQGRRHGYKIIPCWVTLLQLARRAAVLGQPSIAFNLTGSKQCTWLVKYASLHCRKWDQGISLSEPFSSSDFASNYAFSCGLKN
jgi:hypothetical protein